MRIAVETGGLDAAADAARTANHVAALLTETLAGKLAGCGAMAGNDATSATFAESYDAAASEAIGALTDLTHAFIGLGRLLSATGVQHARADAAAAGRVGGYSGAGLQEDAFVRVAPASPPSSLGAQEPSWGVVDRWILDQVEGFVWPGADVGLLRDAAHAWRSAGGSVAGLVDHLDVARAFVDDQRSPEIATVQACLAEVRSLVEDTAAELLALGSACEGYAAAVEDVHARTRALLTEIAQMVVEGLAVSAIVAGVTGPLGGSVALAAAAERVRRHAPRFHALLVGLRSSVAAGSARLRTGRETLGVLRTRFQRYARARDERGELVHPGGWRFQPPRRPGWLRAHEKHPGHTLKKHVGKTEDELRDRLREDSSLDASSAFADQRAAERWLDNLLREKGSEIDDWLASGSTEKLTLRHEFGRSTGTSAHRDGTLTHPTGVKAVLIPDDHGGWQILTAFPD